MLDPWVLIDRLNCIYNQDSSTARQIAEMINLGQLKAADRKLKALGL